MHVQSFQSSEWVYFNPKETCLKYHWFKQNTQDFIKSLIIESYQTHWLWCRLIAMMLVIGLGFRKQCISLWSLWTQVSTDTNISRGPQNFRMIFVLTCKQCIVPLAVGQSVWTTVMGNCDIFLNSVCKTARVMLKILFCKQFCLLVTQLLSNCHDGKEEILSLTFCENYPTSKTISFTKWWFSVAVSII